MDGKKFESKAMNAINGPSNEGAIIQRPNPHNIIVEALRLQKEPRPTRDQLQKLARIQRKRFVAALKVLLDSGDIERSGTGTKNDPYLYFLGPLLQQ